MVRASRKITGIAERYLQAIARRGIRPEAMYLFGSCARGKGGRDSDIDLVVVWRGFQRMGYLRSLALLGEAAAEILEPIQAVPYTPQEFSHPLPGGFLDAIRDECVPVFPLGPDASVGTPNPRP
jgi:predicted nucleotidyltransferase